jgi:hypothetical protein
MVFYGRVEAGREGRKDFLILRFIIAVMNRIFVDIGDQQAIENA